MDSKDLIQYVDALKRNINEMENYFGEDNQMPKGMHRNFHAVNNLLVCIKMDIERED